MLTAIAGEVAFKTTRAAQQPVSAMLKHLAKTSAHEPTVRHQGWLTFGQVRLDDDADDTAPEPIIDTAGELAVLLDGRLFNREELHAQLAQHYRFRTGSHTEVVLAAYRHWGQEFVTRLHGNFAIVVADAQRNRLLLCRDRLGIKPLYLAELDGRLRFASTLPALIASGGIDTSLDKVGLHHYMSWHSIVPAPRTLLAGITKLPPATMRIIEADGRSHDRVYWQPDYARDTARQDWNASQWQEAVQQQLAAAVQRGIVSKERMGVLLSGGLDSSLLVALMAEAGVKDIATYSVGFESVGSHTGNEFEYSDRVAQEFGTDHHTLQLRTEDLYAAVDDAITAMPEPMASHDVVAFYLHSLSVAECSSVVQCGQGADEIFAGYTYHRQAEGISREAALEPFLAAFEDRNHQDLAAVLAKEWMIETNVSRELLEDYVNAPGAETAVDAVLRLETQLILADDPVKRVSSMSMPAGLESVLPFLDHEFVEFVVTCPPELRTAQNGKGILKNIGRELLPTQVVDRPKGYFPVPALQHLQDPMLSRVTEALQAPEARERGLFRDDFVDELLAHPNDHYVPTGGNVRWQVGRLEMWLQQHGVG